MTLLSELAPRMRQHIASNSVASDVAVYRNDVRLRLSRRSERYCLPIICEGSFVDQDDARRIADAFQVPAESSPLRNREPRLSKTGRKLTDYTIEYNWTELAAPDDDLLATISRDGIATRSPSDSVRGHGV